MHVIFCSFKYLNNDGDGTVLKTSALLGNNKKNINSNHAEIVSNSLDEILVELGLDQKAEDVESENLENSLVFFLGSPADMKVKCDNGEEIEDQDGLIIIKNNNYDKCLLSLVGKDNGVYHLITGNTGKTESWSYKEGEIKATETKQLIIEPSSGLLNGNLNEDYYWDLLRQDVDKLKIRYPSDDYLNKAINSYSKRNINNMIDNIFDFRKKQKDKLTDQIIDSLISLMSAKSNLNELTLKKENLTAKQTKSLVDKMTLLNSARKKLPSETGIISYLRAEELLNQSDIYLNIKNYKKSHAYALAAKKYFSEVW